tara:strand:+ start:6213 stop:6635 length:423 start_codon:yes stop_codon:yes gene_type:complete
MKLDQLRNIIREEVRAAVKEELQEVMNEAVRAASVPVQSPKEVVQSFNKQKNVRKTPPTNSITEMLSQTKANMNPEEYRSIIAGTSDMVSKPNFASGIASTMGMTEGPMPGLDISQLDFVKKAGAVYNQSIEKDRAKQIK